MKVNIRLPKARLLLASLLLFSLFFIHQSCTKIDADSSGSHYMTDAEVTQKFFNVPANAPLAVKRAAEEMKKRNAENEYIVKFAKENGYPVWDKAIISFNDNTPASFTGSSSNITGDEDTTVVLPLVPAGMQKVTGFVTANENDSIRLDLYRGGDYSKYTFEDRPGTEVNADKAVLQIMALNKMVFGYTSFKVSDNRLFSNESVYNPSAHPYRVTMKDTVLTQNLIAHCQAYVITLYMEVWYSDGSHIEIEISHWTYWVGNCGSETSGSGSSGTGGSGFPIGNGGTNPGPTGGSPGTGGGGGGTPSSYPCPSTMDRTISAMPCDGVPPPPIDPTPPPKPPCQKVADIFQFANIRSAYHDVHDFASGDAEVGYAFDKLGNGIMSVGVANEGAVPISLVANCITYFHCHNASADYKMFSYTDLEEIFNNIDLSLVNEHIVVGIISPDGTPYLLTIEDRSAFLQAFGNMIINQPDPYRREDKYFKYFKGLDTRAENEMAFLKYMGDINAGIGLVRANDTFTEFTELKLNSDGADVTEYPCSAL